jgi:hypothetical protein
MWATLMMNTIGTLLKQPFSVIISVLGVLLIALPYVEFDKGRFTTHTRTAAAPVVAGTALLILAGALSGLKWRADRRASAGLDLSRVKEDKGKIWTIVSGCEICIVDGLLQDFSSEPGTAIVLPCNEYFDDRCVGDTKSALGAYVNRVFAGQVEAFISLIQVECRNKLGGGTVHQKTEQERAESFGAGRCLLLLKPLSRPFPVALVSTTTQRAGQGLATRISYLFDGMRELVAKLADERINEVVMPILGAGHGRIDPPLALVGLLLALAEAARYGQGGQRLRKVTIVVFRPDTQSLAQVDRIVIRRALALVGSPIESSNELSQFESSRRR